MHLFREREKERERERETYTSLVNLYIIYFSGASLPTAYVGFDLFQSS
jgi:hypothetical protein